jgi:hypothetical protein
MICCSRGLNNKLRHVHLYVTTCPAQPAAGRPRPISATTIHRTTAGNGGVLALCGCVVSAVCAPSACKLTLSARRVQGPSCGGSCGQTKSSSSH